jgi:hypothetical protein
MDSVGKLVDSRIGFLDNIPLFGDALVAYF